MTGEKRCLLLTIQGYLALILGSKPPFMHRNFGLLTTDVPVVSARASYETVTKTLLAVPCTTLVISTVFTWFPSTRVSQIGVMPPGKEGSRESTGSVVSCVKGMGIVLKFSILVSNQLQDAGEVLKTGHSRLSTTFPPRRVRDIHQLTQRPHAWSRPHIIHASSAQRCEASLDINPWKMSAADVRLATIG